jgi:glucokinase
MILAGDIGGTKTNLALVSLRGGVLRIDSVQSFASQRYTSLEATIDVYLAGVEAAIARACFGVAGPVLDGEAAITNLPWRISEEALREKLGLARVRLINDLTALAYAVRVLQSEDLVTIQRGVRDPTGAIGIVAPGTGLGVGYLCWDGTGHRPGASEGGHADFAPANEAQARLLAHLRAEYGHVSWERVLSGPGLYAIYRFLRGNGGAGPGDVAGEWAGEDPSAVISALGLAGSDQLCAQALEMFVSIMGAYGGNLALTLMATGGVYLGGGIPPKILPRLQDGPFIRAFHDKGRLAPVVERIPVHVIQSAHAPLLGAAVCALEL